MYDVCIIGAGTSGMMATISAASMGANVCLIEKNKKPGKKLRLTGGGRCNVTNRRPVDDLIAHIPGNGKFLYSAFSQFNNEDIIQFFEERGVPLKEEDHGRMFPITDSSKTIVNTLWETIQSLNVDVKFYTEVRSLLLKDGKLLGVQTKEETIKARTVIIATGGQSYTYTGSTGIGYKLAKQVNHHVTSLYPTEAPLICRDTVIQKRTLQGLSLQDAQLTVFDAKHKPIASHTLDVLFTHFGLSGPAALRCSMFVNQLLQQQPDVLIELNPKPKWSQDDWNAYIQKCLTHHPNQATQNALNGLLPDRLLRYHLDTNHLLNKPMKQVSPKEWETLVHAMMTQPFHVTKTWPLEKAFVTGGGICVDEISPKTMESKKCPHLYFAGETLDINGYTGGFNITAAFSTGWVAGYHASLDAFSL